MNEEAVVPLPREVGVNSCAVVGLGASAGGLRALMEFFEHTASDTGMAYVVVVHLSPEHESHIAEVLQQTTTMPVRQVTAEIAIQPDHVYVISPRSQLRMEDGKLAPTAPPKRTGNMTIDLFFETLAQAHGNRAIAVVLSGTGTDGTLGMRAVKANGGVTLAETPEQAEYDAMPRSAIAAGVVDFVLPVAEMPDKLARLWRNARNIQIPDLPEQAAPEDAVAEAEDAVRDILATVRARTGHDFSQYKRPTMLRRLERRLQVKQLRNLPAYRALITNEPDEARALMRDFLINVTWFFRDPEVWKVIDEKVVTDLLERSRGGEVRAWVVGCASGEEVYSLAMLFHEHTANMPDPPKVSIFATDIDEEALNFARAGVYPETIAEHVSAERLRRYFVHEQGSYRIQKSVREMVMFAVHNVVQDAPFSRLDLVVCRNLLIYLNRHVQEKLLDLVHFALKPDGYLVLGLSESIEDGHDGFVPVDKTNRIFGQQPRARMGFILASLPTLSPPAPRQATDLATLGGRRLLSFSELHQRLLEHYASPSLVVDDEYDIVHLSDRAGHFLQFGGGEPSLNLLKALPDEVRFDIKSALDEAMQTMLTVERREVPLKRGPDVMLVNLKVHPVRDKSAARTFALLIVDPAGDESVAVPRVVDRDTTGASQTEWLENRLQDVEGQLNAAVEQFEVQNEELKASNEELQATNEELRATTEELETGKEELQSINEELTTVNQELKNKVDESTRISDDLSNFVSATQIAAVFVDRELRLMRYTPFAREIFNVIPSDIGRPLLDITNRLEGVDLGQQIARVFAALTSVEQEARSSDGRFYIVRFLPYRTGDDRIRGAVVTFLEITDRKRAEDAARYGETWSRLVMDSVRDYAILTLSADGTVRSWNDGARQVFGWDSAEVVGQPFEMIFTPEDRAAGVPAAELAKARSEGRAEDDRWHMRKDGTRIFVTGVAAPLDDARQFGYVKLCRDITEQQLVSARRDELLASERIDRAAAEEASRLKDDFLAMLSHELRNPLALVLMQSEIIVRAKEIGRAPRVQQAARVIHEMVRAQAQLVEDMMDVSRARTGKLTVDRQLVPLSFVIADSIGAIRKEAEEKQITLEVQVDDPPLIVAADPLRVRQVGWNLLNNALKFTPAGGTIRVRLSSDGGFARLDVEDTGHGMAPDVAARVFDWTRPFRGTDVHGGLGIGLALVRQLVELQGGRVEAYSEGVGKGSRFSVWLPLEIMAVRRPRESARKGDGGEAAQVKGLRVLIVDDSESSGDALAELLRLEGATVTTVASSASALDQVKSKPFDIIVSDIGMPDGDGYSMIRTIRGGNGKNAKTPAIAYSGFGGSDEIDRARAAGFDLHVTKPSTFQDLAATIARAARRNGAD